MVVIVKLQNIWGICFSFLVIPISWLVFASRGAGGNKLSLEENEPKTDIQNKFLIFQIFPNLSKKLKHLGIRLLEISGYTARRTFCVYGRVFPLYFKLFGTFLLFENWGNGFISDHFSSNIEKGQNGFENLYSCPNLSGIFKLNRLISENVRGFYHFQKISKIYRNRDFVVFKKILEFFEKQVRHF